MGRVGGGRRGTQSAEHLELILLLNLYAYYIYFRIYLLIGIPSRQYSRILRIRKHKLLMVDDVETYPMHTRTHTPRSPL